MNLPVLPLRSLKDSLIWRRFWPEFWPAIAPIVGIKLSAFAHQRIGDSGVAGCQLPAAPGCGALLVPLGGGGQSARLRLTRN